MSFAFLNFKKSLPVYTLKQFEKVLGEKGFTFHHKNNTHYIYANDDYYYVTVPVHGKQLNAMMTCVTLQRIKNGQCRKLDRMTIQKYM